MPVPAGPMRIVRCPTASKSGAQASRASSGPEARITSLPSSAGMRVPSTGASTSVAPVSCASAAHCSVPSRPMVEACHQICPWAGRARRATSSTASASASMVRTTSAPAAADSGSSRTSTPSSRRGCALSGLRFHARTSWPARARLRAMGAPITPVPNAAMVAMSGTLPFSPSTPSPSRCRASSTAPCRSATRRGRGPRGPARALRGRRRAAGVTAPRSPSSGSPRRSARWIRRARTRRRPVAAAVATYLAYRRDEVRRGAAGDCSSLAARAEFDGNPPAAVRALARRARRERLVDRRPAPAAGAAHAPVGDGARAARA